MGYADNFARHLETAVNEAAFEKHHAYRPLKPQHLVLKLAAHARELRRATSVVPAHQYASRRRREPHTHNGVPSYLRKYKRCPSHQPIAKRTSTVLAAFNILAASINIILRGNTICPSVRFLLTKQKLPYEVRYE